MKKYTGIHKMSDNKFLNLFKLDALTDAGRKFDYYFVSRRKEKELKISYQRQPGRRRGNLSGSQGRPG